MSFSFKHKNVFLKKGKAKPFWYRHPWVFSGAVKSVKGKPENGDIVEVFDHDRRFIAKGFYNDQSQIMVRLLTWDLHEKLDYKFFERQISQAVHLRDNVLALSSKTNAYRLIHSEADGLPGLTVDRYDNVLCVQLTSFGMDRRRDMIFDILQKVTKVPTIVERYSSGIRKQEGLPEIDYSVTGEKPPETLTIHEYGLNFRVSLSRGQKTGFYIDQRENRLLASKFSYNKRVLDACCYSGAFGIYMSKKGKAKEVVFLDTSKFALEIASENASLNNCSNCSFEHKDVFNDLEKMHKDGEKFDTIVLDPPKVITSKSSLHNGLMALKSINATAMKMLTNHGILITCDCSGMISVPRFMQTINAAAMEAECEAKIIDSRSAGQDHPQNPACPENSYLKTLFVSITKKTDT